MTVKIVLACMGNYIDEFVEQTLNLFSEKNVELTLLFVVEKPTNGLQSSSLREKIREDLRKQGKKVLSETYKKFEAETSDKNFKLNAVMAEGKPAEEISTYAKDNNMDIIMVGSGKKQLDKNLLGSVTEEVVHSAPCHVILLKMPKR